MKEFINRIKRETEHTIALDFDGVIHKNSKGFHDGTIYDEPVDGVHDAVITLSSRYYLIVYTCKANSERPLINGKTGKELIWDWLWANDLAEFIMDVTDKKPRAKYYIDDKGIKFVNWEQVLEEI